MSRSVRAICLLALIASFPLRAHEGTQVEEWKSAQPGWNYEFPRDHGPHREFKTEWWYATGNLSDEQGHEYGFQLTFFRQGIHPGKKPAGSSRFRVMDLPFAHFAFTDVSGKTFRYYQRSSRGAFGEAGFGAPDKAGGRMAWMENWVLEQLSDGSFHLKSEGVTEAGLERSVDLILTQDRPPLIHGANGISPKSSKPGHASHYYSLTRLRASGLVTLDGKQHRVKGLVWFDHEWATNSLEAGEAGWDWSGLHLSNGDDLMLFRIRNSEGKTVFLAGTLRDGKGVLMDLHDLSMTPQGTWKSPHTGGLYPDGMQVSIPSRNLTLLLTPKLQDQELVLSPFAYWEGAVRGEGKCGTDSVTAEGYLELTGYGGKVIGVNEK
jgi:predicted secreted hydrolase